jgi:hypothetical protein
MRRTVFFGLDDDRTVGKETGKCKTSRTQIISQAHATLQLNMEL